tara:strand:- start:1528 stop:1773 length:246 start_codon:yes stop_codon:yes gene_type:complete
MYDPKPSKDYCESLDLQFSEADFEQFAACAMSYDFTQDQLDFAMMQHAWRVKHLFTPAAYSVMSRFKLAAYFLNPFSKGIK